MDYKYRSYAALEAIARNTLKNFDDDLLSGQPCAIPIEKLAAHLGLCIEYQCLRKNGVILGEMVYDNTLVPVYFRDLREYTLIEVSGKTIILDESLLKGRNDGRLRFTCAHEIAHWLLHQDIYLGTGQAAALGNPKKSSEENPIVERQANQLATLLLMPKVQVKKALYSVRSKTITDPTATLAELFEVSKQAIGIYLQEHNLI
ncbi:MAG: ImmA/IrrE family metallo-endopeptidase [Defluviitaleaceae bacterium]|nr:ImmA/IrrE family metallo-endopeptidase [Defluviitaleaceae bacterium]